MEVLWVTLFFSKLMCNRYPTTMQTTGVASFCWDLQATCTKKDFVTHLKNHVLNAIAESGSKGVAGVSWWCPVKDHRSLLWSQQKILYIHPLLKQHNHCQIQYIHADNRHSKNWLILASHLAQFDQPVLLIQIRQEPADYPHPLAHPSALLTSPESQENEQENLIIIHTYTQSYLGIGMND